jgi:hypothetical protein
VHSTFVRGYSQARWPLVCFLMALTALALPLTACGAGAAANAQTQKATPTLTPHPTVLPASTLGWAIYTDKRFHFQVLIPPGWQAKAYTTFECVQGGDGNYVVGFFPPDVGVPVDDPFRVRESIAIYLPLCPPDEEPTPNPDRPVPEPGGILIGTTRAPYYVHDGYEWISRYTSTKFGGQAYLFNFDAMPQDKGLRDLPLFHGMLAGFKYLG